MMISHEQPLYQVMMQPLHAASVKVKEDIWSHAELNFVQEEEFIGVFFFFFFCCPHNCVNMQGPCEVIGDMQYRVFKKTKTKLETPSISGL